MVFGLGLRVLFVLPQTEMLNMRMFETMEQRLYRNEL